MKRNLSLLLNGLLLTGLLFAGSTDLMAQRDSKKERPKIRRTTVVSNSKKKDQKAKKNNSRENRRDNNRWNNQRKHKNKAVNNNRGSNRDRGKVTRVNNNRHRNDGRDRDRNRHGDRNRDRHVDDHDDNDRNGNGHRNGNRNRDYRDHDGHRGHHGYNHYVNKHRRHHRHHRHFRHDRHRHWDIGYRYRHHPYWKRHHRPRKKFYLQFGWSPFFCLDLRPVVRYHRYTQPIIRKKSHIVYTYEYDAYDYRPGDPIGYSVHINFNGKVKVYDRYYDSDPVLAKKFYLDERELRKLERLLDKGRFYDDGRTLNDNYGDDDHPAYATISYRPTKYDRMRSVSLNMKAPEDVHPRYYLRFIDRIERILTDCGYFEEN